jgi:hypothetical protein
MCSLLIGLAGCSSESKTVSSTAPAGTSNSSTSKTTNIDPEQPDRIAEVYGKVKSIQGNVVLIAEMQRQQTGAELSDADKAKRQAEMQSLSAEERQKSQASQEVMTGKNITMTVPVGIPIKIKGTGSNGPTVQDGTIASIKVGSVVNIWIEKSDPTSAEYMSISNRSN